MHVTRIFFLLLGSNLDEVVDAEDCDGCLSGKLETLDLAHGWLQDPGRLVVSHCLSKQIQPHPTQVDTQSHRHTHTHTHIPETNTFLFSISTS